MRRVHDGDASAFVRATQRAARTMRPGQDGLVDPSYPSNSSTEYAMQPKTSIASPLPGSRCHQTMYG
jgi:hypothetical protein